MRIEDKSNFRWYDRSHTCTLSKHAEGIIHSISSSLPVDRHHWLAKMITYEGGGWADLRPTQKSGQF